MKVRVILVCTLLLLAAYPLFALPVCQECDFWSNTCQTIPGAIETCKYDSAGNCYTTFDRCSVPRSETTVLTDWKVASIEIHRPSLDSITVTAPAQVAAAAVETPEPAQQK